MKGFLARRNAAMVTCYIERMTATCLSTIGYLSGAHITRSVQLPYEVCETTLSQVELFLN